MLVRRVGLETQRRTDPPFSSDVLRVVLHPRTVGVPVPVGTVPLLVLRTAVLNFFFGTTRILGLVTKFRPYQYDRTAVGALLCTKFSTAVPARTPL